jgi:hypothetical protein
VGWEIRPLGMRDTHDGPFAAGGVEMGNGTGFATGWFGRGGRGELGEQGVF